MMNIRIKVETGQPTAYTEIHLKSLRKGWLLEEFVRYIKTEARKVLMGANHLHLEFLDETSLFSRLKRRGEAYTYKLLLRFYIFGAELTQMPFIGNILKWQLEWYGTTQHGGKVISKEEAYQWVEKAVSILCSVCYCRDTFRNCSDHLFTCLRISDVELFKIASKGRAKFISKCDAKKIIEDSEKRGFFHLAAWCSYPYVYSICNCCTCCCVAYQIWKRYGIESSLKKGDMVASIINDLCINCGRCVEQCRFKALNRLLTGEIEFNEEKCFGCGICREVCESGAIKLRERRY